MHFRDFTKEQAAAYLAAMIDGEGCIYYRRVKLPDGHNQQARVITFTNTDRELVDAVVHCMSLLGIEHSKVTTSQREDKGYKRTWTVEIRKGAAMWRFREQVPIQTKRKIARLDGALETYRGLHCHGCGCLHDEKTDGCTNCRKRHYFRDASKRSRSRKAAANDNQAAEVAA